MKNLILFFSLLCLCFMGYGQTICIDPGHGGSDPGAVGHGLEEEDVVLDVAHRLKSMLERYGWKVYMTRSGDSSVSLSQRTSYANSLRVNYFVSIHCNSAASSSAHGTETFHYYNASSTSKEMARQVQPRLYRNLGTRDRGVKTAGFYVIKHTSMPAILCELAFISNAHESKNILASSHYRDMAAQAIRDGLLALRSQRQTNTEDLWQMYAAPVWSSDGSGITVRQVESEATKFIDLSHKNILPASHAKQQAKVSVKDGMVYYQGQVTKVVSDDKDLYFNPVLSPDGEKVLFHGLKTGMHVVDLVTGTHNKWPRASNGNWFPSSDRILFEIALDNAHFIISSDLYMVSLKKPEKIMALTSNLAARRPAISPDGNYVAFDSQGSIFIARFIGNQLDKPEEVK